MGKSRLAYEAVRATSGAQVVVVRAEPYGAASAYRVFRDPLRRLLGLSVTHPRRWARHCWRLSQGSPPTCNRWLHFSPTWSRWTCPTPPRSTRLDPQFRPDRLADAIVRLVDEAMPGPLILVAEEAHWADAASARLLDRLGAASAGRPWAVIAVRRGEEGGFAPARGTRITLDPLPTDVMERLVIAATEATPLRPHEIAAVVDRAQGNPLFVEEVTRVAIDTGSLDTLPESVQAVMSAQIDLLQPDARRVLRYCAVLGRSFREEVLHRTLATDGLVADESTFSSLGTFLQADGPDRWRFRNSLVRDAAYEGLAYRIRSRLHRAAGRDAGGDQHRSGCRLPDSRVALLAVRRRRACLALRPDGWAVGTRVLRQRRRRGAVRTRSRGQSTSSRHHRRRARRDLGDSWRSARALRSLGWIRGRVPAGRHIVDGSGQQSRVHGPPSSGAQQGWCARDGAAHGGGRSKASSAGP